MDPQVSEHKVPAYDIVEAHVRHLDNTVIIFRVYYVIDKLTYRFQLIKKNRMCIVEISRSLLDSLKKGSAEAERELAAMLESFLESGNCWKDIAV